MIRILLEYKIYFKVFERSLNYTFLNGVWNNERIIIVCWLFFPVCLSHTFLISPFFAPLDSLSLYKLLWISIKYLRYNSDGDGKLQQQSWRQHCELVHRKLPDTRWFSGLRIRLDFTRIRIQPHFTIFSEIIRYHIIY